MNASEPVGTIRALWRFPLRVSASIAAASVVAKVSRDRIMARLHEHWPTYDFLGHKGYITPVHNAALDEHGIQPFPMRRSLAVAREHAEDARVRDAPPARRRSPLRCRESGSI